MKKHLIRFICLFLPVLLSFGMLSSCGDAPNQPAGTTESVIAATEPPATETEEDTRFDKNGYEKDEIGDFDYKGKDFTLLYWSDVSEQEFQADTVTGVALNDAVYRRNLNVSSRTQINLRFEACPGNSSNIAKFSDKVQAAISSGDTTYDMIGAYSLTAGYMAMRGLFYDLNSCKYFEWEKPWWPETLMSQIIINDKLFFASGDISANCTYMMYVTFFNKDILEDKKLENPYQLVDNNQWTFDKMWEMCKGVNEDTNKNGANDLGDLAGNSFYQIHLDAYYLAGGLTFLKVNNGTVELNEDFLGDRAIDIFERIVAFANDSTAAVWLPEYKSGFTNQAPQWFADGLSLFWTDRCFGAKLIMEGGVKYGVVPVPKPFAEQDRWYTPISNTYTLYCLPSNTQDPDFASSVMEIFASESYREVTPVVYDNTIKYRYADDADAARMFDLVRANIIFDLGRIFSNTFNVPSTIAEKALMAGTSWAVTVKGTERTWRNALKTLLKSFE